MGFFARRNAHVTFDLGISKKLRSPGGRDLTAFLVRRI